MNEEAPPVALDLWLRRLQAAAGLTADTVSVTAAEQQLLLDIARVSAHTSVRVAAPISTYLLGLVMAETPPDRRADELSRIYHILAPET
jgi:hypothetical protein